MTASSGIRVCIIQPYPPSRTETFLEAHARYLPGEVVVIYGGIPHIAGRPLCSQRFVARAWRKAVRLVRRRGWDWELTTSYLRAFRRHRPAVVLAEYGDTGTDVLEACRRFGVPLVVHFHGYDASIHAVLEQYAERYRQLFHEAAAVVAVSRAMSRKLVALGAPPEKVCCNPYGVDCSLFGGADPGRAGPVFLAVGRLCEKKAPHLTLLAFAEVRRQVPAARLRMVGDGPLRGVCLSLARALGLADAVTFLGAQSHETVQAQMRLARGFVQHSVEAANGDAEGTPVAILEAGASGLPVVATRHAGIPDVVVPGQTGFLVDEYDTVGMAAYLLRLAREPELAARLGGAARAHVQAHFSMPKRIGRLGSILRAAAQGGSDGPGPLPSDPDLDADVLATGQPVA